MHIGINAQLLSFRQDYRNGGISRYIRYLLTGLAKQPGEHEYTVFLNGQDVIERLRSEFIGGTFRTQITYVSAPWPESRPFTRVAWEQFSLPSLLRSRHIDVFHSPANVLPELLPPNCAGVVTLHDLAFLRYPNVLTRSKRIYHRTFTVHSLQRATRIIAASESTRQDAIELVGVPAERVATVYPCINGQTLFPSDEEIEVFRQKQGVESGFLLYLGTLEPRKNIPALIEAYALLRKNHRIGEKLVIAGGKGWCYDSIFERVASLGLESEVVFPDYVSDSERTLWYAAASAFVYPSLYEGFGMPVAEALVSGIPVVTSNVSSLPEAGAGIALCVNPLDTNAMAEALYKALTDSDYRQQCQQLAPTVAQRFSAQKMVERTLDVYEQAYATLQKPYQKVSFIH